MKNEFHSKNDLSGESWRFGRWVGGKTDWMGGGGVWESGGGRGAGEDVFLKNYLGFKIDDVVDPFFKTKFII